MEKLTVKNLAPYLPYGLKMHTNAGIWDLVVYKTQPEYKHGVMIGEAINCGVKPILRPISDLLKQIEINNEKFIPVEYFEIGDEDEGTEYDHGNIKTIKQLEDISKHNCFHDIHYLPYLLVQKLIEWHFDIYGLIDKKLAIDINTL